MLEGYSRKHKHMTVNVIFDLFDTLSKTILLYVCEVWGIKIGNDIEQLHLRFMKKVLGVKPSTKTSLISQKQRDFLYMLVYISKL